MYCEGNSDLFGFCIFWKREPPHPLELERSNSSAPSNDARFTQQRPSESYDANVSHFVLHTSSLISLLRGSVQVGQPDTTSGSCDTAFTLSVQIFFRLHHSPFFILSNVFSPFCFFKLLCFGCSSSCFLSLSLFVLRHLFFLTELTLSLSFSQCCKRKLVAMLISLFEALRASRASILEKPISTNRATCRGRNQLRDISSRQIIKYYIRLPCTCTA